MRLREGKRLLIIPNTCISSFRARSPSQRLTKRHRRPPNGLLGSKSFPKSGLGPRIAVLSCARTTPGSSLGNRESLDTGTRPSKPAGVHCCAKPAREASVLKLGIRRLRESGQQRGMQSPCCIGLGKGRASPREKEPELESGNWMGQTV